MCTCIYTFFFLGNKNNTFLYNSFSWYQSCWTGALFFLSRDVCTYFILGIWLENFFLGSMSVCQDLSIWLRFFFSLSLLSSSLSSCSLFSEKCRKDLGQHHLRFLQTWTYWMEALTTWHFRSLQRNWMEKISWSGLILWSYFFGVRRR